MIDQREFSIIPRKPDWRVMEPQWARDVGLLKTAGLTRWVYSTAHLRQVVREDGLYQLEPIVTAYRQPPAEVRSEIGRSTWKKFHHSTQFENAWRAKLIILTKLPLDVILAIPKGGLRRAYRLTQRVGIGPVQFAVTRAKNGKQMIFLADLAHDLVRMGGTINPAWSENRLRREHDIYAHQWAAKFASPDTWAEPWSFEHNGFVFTLLRSEKDFKVEAISQKHCVASYHARAKRGDEIVFRIEGKERATVAWNRRTKHMEIKGARNTPVSVACKAAAHHAIASYKGKPK